MTKKDTVKKNDPEQSRRFVETAKKCNVDKSINKFNAAMKKVRISGSVKK